nr:PREDICTED: uncharacterized aarF domain-containing protein kinase 5 isoform X2 [Linepithema humile]
MIMLRTRLLGCVNSSNYFATRLLFSKRFKYVGTGVTLLSVSYAFLPSRKKRVVKSVLGSWLRFTRSLKIGMTISMDYLIAPIMGCTESEIHQRSADRIVQGCLQNGGIYIKLGQGLAAMNNILPKEYTKSLSTLQDKCLIREKDEMEEIFVQDFVKKSKEMLREIEPEPVAAASLAQVYKGVTLDGNKVAIKVRYIDLHDRFLSDLNAIVYLLKAITIIHPKFDLHWVLDEMIDTLRMELDFENEGKNGEQCAKDLKKFNYAYIPKVYWNLSSKRILTTEWIDGIKITDIEGIQAEDLNLADIDQKLITLMGEQIFHTGFVHADPHPGNDYVLLAEMLSQAPYKVSFTSRPNNITLDEYMIKKTQERFDKITAILRSMPKSIMLILRNLNTVRAIIKDHGDVINRYRLMAIIATRGKYQTAKQPFYKIIAGIFYVTKFEIRIFYNNLLQWINKVYLTLLKLLNYDVTPILQTL